MIYEEMFFEKELPGFLNKIQFYSYFKQHKQGDMKEREIIIKHNIRLVISEVNRRFSNTIYGCN